MQGMVQLGDEMLLAAGDLFEFRDLCQQRLHRRAFMCGDGGRTAPLPRRATRYWKLPNVLAEPLGNAVRAITSEAG